MAHMLTRMFPIPAAAAAMHEDFLRRGKARKMMLQILADLAAYSGSMQYDIASSSFDL
jgi:hypothetical protein